MTTIEAASNPIPQHSIVIARCRYAALILLLSRHRSTSPTRNPAIDRRALSAGIAHSSPTMRCRSDCTPSGRSAAIQPRARQPCLLPGAGPVEPLQRLGHALGPDFAVVHVHTFFFGCPG